MSRSSLHWFSTLRSAHFCSILCTPLCLPLFNLFLLLIGILQGWGCQVITELSVILHTGA